MELNKSIKNKTLFKIPRNGKNPKGISQIIREFQVYTLSMEKRKEELNLHFHYFILLIFAFSVLPQIYFNLVNN